MVFLTPTVPYAKISSVIASALLGVFHPLCSVQVCSSNIINIVIHFMDITGFSTIEMSYIIGFFSSIQHYFLLLMVANNTL